MSNQEFSNILKGVTIAQIFNMIFIVGSLSVGGAFGVAAIRGDITANAVTEQIHHIETKHSIDSMKNDMSAIWSEIRMLEKRPVHNSSYSNVTERYINGKLVLIPVQ